MINFEVVARVSQEVRPEIVAKIAGQFLGYLDARGWRLVWSCKERPEPTAKDGSEMSYEDMAEEWVVILQDSGEEL